MLENDTNVVAFPVKERNVLIKVCIKIMTGKRKIRLNVIREVNNFEIDALIVQI